MATQAGTGLEKQHTWKGMLPTTVRNIEILLQMQELAGVIHMFSISNKEFHYDAIFFMPSADLKWGSHFLCSKTSPV